MIKFFRKIRYKLMETGKTYKYLKYAIGEIILVVIGILIALQINNWNQNRKDLAKGDQYLKGIKEDLAKDLIQIDSIIKLHSLDVSLISSIDSVFHKNSFYFTEQFPYLFKAPDTSLINSVFYRNTSFRSINGTYNALISDGQSGLIKNKELFQAIQQIYGENQERLSSTYDAIKALEQNISWSYTYEKFNWTYADLKNAKDKKIFLDLVNFTEQKYWYILNTIRIKNNSEKVIVLIDEELSNH